MSRRFNALVLTLALAFALAACGSGPGQTPDKSAGGTNADTEKGAAAFASYWVDTLNEATDSGDTTALKQLAAKDCAFCADFAKSLDQIYGGGGRVETDGWDLRSEVPIANQTKENPGIQLNLQVAPQKVYRTKTGKPQSYEGGKQGIRMFLVREGDHWLVKKIEPGS